MFTYKVIIVILLTFNNHQYGMAALTGQCNVCFSSGIACLDEQTFARCSDNTPSPIRTLCPSGRVCTAESSICLTTALGALPVCYEDQCGLCASVNNNFACLSETSYAFCYDGETPSTSSISSCPLGYVCDLRSPEVCSSSETANPSCISATTTAQTTTDVSTEPAFDTTTDTATDSETTTDTTTEIATSDTTTDVTNESPSDTTNAEATETGTETSSETTTAATDSTTDFTTDTTIESSTDETSETTDIATDTTIVETDRTTDITSDMTTDSTKVSTIEISTDTTIGVTTETTTETTIIPTTEAATETTANTITVTTTTINPTTSSTTIMPTTKVPKDANTYCAEIAKKGCFRVDGDKTCSKYIYCYLFGGQYLGWYYTCRNYFNAKTGKCQKNRPVDC